jgi:hypothetical protein
MISDNASSHVVSFAKAGKSHGFSTLKLSNMKSFGILSSQCYKCSSTFGSRYNSIFQNSIQKKLLRWVLSHYDDATLKDLRKVVPNIKQAIMWSYEV